MAKVPAVLADWRLLVTPRTSIELQDDHHCPANFHASMWRKTYSIFI